MERSGYSDGCDGWELIRWRGAVTSAIKGKRGQALLLDLKDALEAMPERRLVRSELECADGVCALGALGRQRGLALDSIDTYDREAVADLFGVAEALAAEIMHVNDDSYRATPEQRWAEVHAWVVANLREGKAASA